MNSSSLCILNCVEDARLFLFQHGDDVDKWTLVSTHGAVNDFLSVKKIDCVELSSLITDAFLIEAYRVADRQVEKVLKDLDEYYARDISDTLGIPNMSYFYPLYVYLGKYEYLSILKLKEAFNMLYRTNSFGKVVIYRSVPTSFFSGDYIQLSVIQSFLTKHGTSLEVVENKPRSINKRSVMNEAVRLVNTAIKNPQKIFNKIREYLPTKIDDTRKTILLLEPLADFSFLKRELPRYNIVLWPIQGIPQSLRLDLQLDFESIMHRLSDVFSLISDNELKKMPLADVDIFKQSVLLDFMKNHRERIIPLLCLDRFSKMHPVDLAIWAIPPIMWSKCLITAYLQRNKTPIIGTQHGGTYVVQESMNIHFDSDFARCSHFFSYGFDEQDVYKTYPQKTLQCEIIPVGCYQEHYAKGGNNKAPKRGNIDILFPITNSLSFYLEALRINSSKLNLYQREIIKLLDQFADMNVYIKPLPEINDTNCSTLELFKELKHARLLKNISLIECLNSYTIKAVVMDYPSTPLYEVIGKDMEILLLSDPILPFSPEASSLLKKRVHYFEDIEELKTGLKKYRQGILPILRNDEFYKKYVYRRNTKESILGTIETLMHEKHDALNYGAA